MSARKMTIVEREDLGPVLARADHKENVIEVNGKAFYNLPPLVQEFVLCHEVCHLRHEEWDEARTNALASRLFLNRATDEADRAKRQEFLSYLDGSDTSNIDILGLLGAAFGLGTTVASIIIDRNSGWYSWSRSTQRRNLNAMLDAAFKQSRRTSKHAASEYFWQVMKQYDHKDDDLTQFLKRTENKWVEEKIAKYEKAYGFGFDEVTPVDLRAFPLLMAVMGAVGGFVVYKLIKTATK